MAAPLPHFARHHLQCRRRLCAWLPFHRTLRDGRADRSREAFPPGKTRLARRTDFAPMGTMDDLRERRGDRPTGGALRRTRGDFLQDAVLWETGIGENHPASEPCEARASGRQFLPLERLKSKCSRSLSSKPKARLAPWSAVASAARHRLGDARPSHSARCAGRQTLPRRCRAALATALQGAPRNSHQRLHFNWNRSKTSPPQKSATCFPARNLRSDHRRRGQSNAASRRSPRLRPCGWCSHPRVPS